MDKHLLDLPPVDEELYALMLYNIEDYAVVILDPDGNILSLNKGAEIIKGYKKDEVIHQSFSIFYTDEDIKNDKPFQNLQLAVKNGFHKEEAIRIRKDGSKFLASISLTALKNSNGELRGFTKIIKDITKEKEAEDLLISNEKQLTFAQKLAHIGSWEWNLKDNLMIGTEELFNIFGINDHPLEVTFEMFLSKLHSDSKPEVIAKFREVINSKNPFDFYEKIVRDDGEVRFLHIIGNVITNSEGLAEKLYGSCQDVTESKYQEEKLISSNDLLESMIQKRTLELTNLNKTLKKEISERKKSDEQRKVALEKIENSLKEKELLLKEIHHRVKNNLQIISSLLNIQSTYIKDDKSLDLFKESQNRVRSMALIHEKLYQSSDMSQIDFPEYVKGLVSNLFGSYNLNPEHIILHQNVNNMIIGIDLAINLGFILNELISNAFKHAFPDGRKGNLYITMNRAEDSCELIVEDDGVGFPPGKDFKKMDSLGLQLILTLVEQIGGTIDLKTDRGTKFTVKF
jgi:PAS domain S-box-containing protein